MALSETGAATVETSAGPVRGLREQGVEVYRGIPFAAPPLGALRFRAPVPAEPWGEVRDATRFGATPPQRPGPLEERLGLLGATPIGEDCLHLNVFTPRADAARRPVLVWIHGGAFLTGSGTAQLYDGARLAARGDAVLVTLNYRVGALGFLHLDGADPNRGLLDQLAALQWVRREIERFGGDPERVTVFGESAGAGSICALLAIPAARGLFKRAIVQSAAPDGMLSAEEGARRAEHFSSRLGSDPRQAPIEGLLDAQDRCLADGPWASGMFFSPVIDGALLPALPSQAIAAGSARDVELVIGTAREELQLYAMDAPADAIGADALPLLVGQVVPGDAGALVIETYRKSRPTATPGELYWAIFTDMAMRWPATRLAERQAEQQAAAWMYLFTWPSPRDAGRHGAVHAIDLAFTFGRLDAPGMAEFAGKGPAAEQLSANLMDAWLAFARSGDPSHDGIGTWPRYDAARRATLLLGERCEVVDAPAEAERAVWDGLLETSAE